MTYTTKQLNDYAAFEEVRQSGVINMFDQRAGCRLTGLTDDEYVFVMSNYSELKAEMIRDRKTERKPRSTPYERTRATVYATGNKWAIENFNATHS